jgi:menaquinone-specific isochorismate synthase
VRLPDPRRYRASSRPLPSGSPIDPFVVAADRGPATVTLDRALAAIVGTEATRGGTCVVSGDLRLAGRGTAVTLDFPTGLHGADPGAVAAWLGSVPTDEGVGRPGSGPLAMGALPFAATERGRLQVPSLVVGSDAEGRSWLTVVSPRTDLSSSPADLDTLVEALAGLAGVAGRDPGQTAPDTRPTGAAGHDELRPVPSEAAFLSLVEAALDAIEGGSVVKVVLQRRVEATIDGSVDLVPVLRRLHQLEPDCTVFAVVAGTGDERGPSAFVGATPELLIRRRGRNVTSHPLAGTVGRSDDPDLDAEALLRLRSSTKEQVEHRVAAEAVASTLRPWCDSLEVADEPEVLLLNGMAHLGTPMHGVLAEHGDRGPGDALTLAAALHPTPAVAGSPTAAAVALLADLERAPRGRYAGPVGWLDGRGDGDFVVGIRSASIEGERVAVYAGVGIVAGSDPKEELAETTLKLRTALAALQI